MVLRTRWVKRVLAMFGIVVVVLVVTPRFGTQTSKVGPGSVAVGFRPVAGGRTTLVLPPLGQVSAATHPGPVEMRLELRSLDVAGLIDGTGQADTGAMTDQIRRDLPAAVRASVIRMLIVAAVIGAAAAALLPARRRNSILGGGVLGMVTIALLMASAIPDFDAGKFDEVTFQGSLSSGSKLLGTITGGATSPIGRRLGTLSDRLAGLYSSTLTDEVDASSGETVILHISDLHLNPIGVELSRRLATSFDVDAVLDTGDTTSFGSPFEGRFASLIADFPVPYLYVGGNHDSFTNRAAIAATPGVVGIDRRIATVGDVRILGFDDPVVTTDRHSERAERERIEAAAAPELKRLALADDPDVIAVHNPVILRGVVGAAPVAVAGHLHRFELGARKGTVIAVVGSTGATGLGSLLSEADLPYSAELLRFRGHELVAIDHIEVVGTSGDLVVRRHTVTAADRAGNNAAFIGGDVDEGTRATEPTTTTTDSTTTTESDTTDSSTTELPTTTGG